MPFVCLCSASALAFGMCKLASDSVVMFVCQKKNRNVLKLDLALDHETTRPTDRESETNEKCNDATPLL